MKKILKKCSKYKCGSNMCDICVSKKADIIRKKQSGMSFLNIWSELMASCRNRKKMLSNLKTHNKNKKERENQNLKLHKKGKKPMCA